MDTEEIFADKLAVHRKGPHRPLNERAKSKGVRQSAFEGQLESISGKASKADELRIDKNVGVNIIISIADEL